uniref:RxLR effector protein n=2 Tax=Hyaloperonospora arabidopsidis (strain Emoy2) TaxID=559515 RepID=M4B9V2_HYAAE
MRATSAFWVTTTAALLLAGSGIQSVESTATSTDLIRSLGTAPSADQLNVQSLRSKTATTRAAGHRLLRAVETKASDSKSIDAKVLEDILHNRDYAEATFSSWLRNGQSRQDIEVRLTEQGLLSKYSSVIDQYDSYCLKHVDA